MLLRNTVLSYPFLHHHHRSQQQPLCQEYCHLCRCTWCQNGNEPTPPALSKRAFTNTTEPMMPEIMLQSSCSCLSDIDVKLSKINVLFSEISQLLSPSHVPVFQSRKLLPRIDIILSEIMSFVSYTQDGAPDNDESCSVDLSDLEMEWDDNHNNFYHLYYPDSSTDDAKSVHAYSDDDAESVHAMSEDSDDVAGRSQEEHDVITTGQLEHDVITTGQLEHDVIITQGVFIAKMISIMSSLAPSNIYDAKRAQRKRRKQIRKKVDPELRTLWTHAASIISPFTPTEMSTSLSYPTIDWSTVNKRFINNIPSPSLQPIFGCSEDSNFYEDVFERSDHGYHRNLGSKFTKPNPFGAVLGYLTDAGVVGVPDKVFHGHVFDPHGGWILHAKFSGKEETKRTKIKETKKKDK